MGRAVWNFSAALAPDLAELARRRLDEALETWVTCLKANHWPGYPPFTHYAEAPGWMLAQEESRTIARAALREADNRRIRVAQRFQAERGMPARLRTCEGLRDVGPLLRAITRVSCNQKRARFGGR
jgi:hypothetical protein